MWAWVKIDPVGLAIRRAFAARQGHGARICIARSGPGSSCVVVTVVVSCMTKPKPDSELTGLVYGCTDDSLGRRHALYQRPIFWAGSWSRGFRDLSTLSSGRENIHASSQECISIWFFIGLLLARSTAS